MGLDIRGYYGVKLVGIREATDEEYEEPLITVHCDDCGCWEYAAYYSQRSRSRDGWTHWTDENGWRQDRCPACNKKKSA